MPELHSPVLLRESVEALRIKPAGVYVDGTFGRGGHSAAILRRLGAGGRLLAIDRDDAAVAYGVARFGADERFTIHQGSFAMLDRLTQSLGVRGMVDGLLLDLGVSSPQLDTAMRGFSFSLDGPLDMRMDSASTETAAKWVNSAPQADIERVLRVYGEERYARRIARAIVEARGQAPIGRTRQLADLVAKACPSREPGKHPATRTFQAIRIHVNKELEALEACLQQALTVLAPYGRLVVISFHSLEDRIVKRFFRDESRGDRFPPGLPVTADQLKPNLMTVGKAVRAGTQEVALNPRARSAVMRVAERLP